MTILRTPNEDDYASATRGLKPVIAIVLLLALATPPSTTKADEVTDRLDRIIDILHPSRPWSQPPAQPVYTVDPHGCRQEVRFDQSQPVKYACASGMKMTLTSTTCRCDYPPPSTKTVCGRTGSSPSPFFRGYGCKEVPNN